MKKVAVPLSIIVLAAGLAGAMVVLKKQPDKAPVPDATLIVDVAAVERREAQFTVASQGTVGPHTETTLVAEVSGMVLAVSPKFVAGGVFDQGEVLLRIDPADYDVALQQAKANLASMQAKLTLERARAEQAEKEWDMSGRARDKAPLLALRTPYLEEARAGVQSAEAELKKAERKLDRTIIRAPYRGMVRSKAADVGQYVGSGSQLGETVAIDFAEVRLPLSDRDLAQLELPRPGAVGDPNGPLVELRATIAGREHVWQVPLHRTEGVIDERSRVHFAVVRITDPYGLNALSERPPLALGTFVRARIPGLRRSDLLAVPRHAVRADNSVYVMDGSGLLQIRTISIAGDDEEYIYAVDGIEPSDRVITSAVDVPVVGRPLRVAGAKP